MDHAIGLPRNWHNFCSKFVALVCLKSPVGKHRTFKRKKRIQQKFFILRPLLGKISLTNAWVFFFPFLSLSGLIDWYYKIVSNFVMHTKLLVHSVLFFY